MSLKELREKKGWTLETLGNKVGLSLQAISLYETGQRQPRIETIKKLAEVLEVPVAEILECF